jgi:transcriptional regulator
VQKIEISEIQCKYKLSQNRSAVDQNQVIEQLENRGSIQLSQAMKNGL